jgi:hypothetical protein
MEPEFVNYDPRVIAHKSATVRGVQRFLTTESAEHAEKELWVSGILPGSQGNRIKIIQTNEV